MANDISGWPWIIDTPGASIVINGGIILKRIRWVAKDATGGEDAVITDNDDREVWRSVTAGVNYVESEIFENAIPIHGLKVPTLESGILYIYYNLSGRKWPVAAK